MTRFPKHSPTNFSLWLISRLLLSALMLRALVPVGYMPDLEAARSGILSFVDCRNHAATMANAHEAAEHKADGEHNGDEHHHHHHEDNGDGTVSDICPFASITATALIFDIPALPPVLILAVLKIRSGPAAFNLPPVKVGTPLGPRAPPHIS